MAGKTYQKFRHAFLTIFLPAATKNYICIRLTVVKLGRTRGRDIPSLVHMSVLVTTREVRRSLRLKNLAVMDSSLYLCRQLYLCKKRAAKPEIC